MKRSHESVTIKDRSPSLALTGAVVNEPAHEIMVLFGLRKLILQTHMRSHPVGLDV